VFQRIAWSDRRVTGQALTGQTVNRILESARRLRGWMICALPATACLPGTLRSQLKTGLRRTGWPGPPGTKPRCAGPLRPASGGPARFKQRLPRTLSPYEQWVSPSASSDVPPRCRGTRTHTGAVPPETSRAPKTNSASFMPVFGGSHAAAPGSRATRMRRLSGMRAGVVQSRPLDVAMQALAAIGF
jgi:hypothetical protein